MDLWTIEIEIEIEIEWTAGVLLRYLYSCECCPSLFGFQRDFPRLPYRETVRINIKQLFSCNSTYTSIAYFSMLEILKYEIDEPWQCLPPFSFIESYHFPKELDLFKMPCPNLARNFLSAAPADEETLLYHHSHFLCECRLEYPD